MKMRKNLYSSALFFCFFFLVDELNPDSYKCRDDFFSGKFMKCSINYRSAFVSVYAHLTLIYSRLLKGN